VVDAATEDAFEQHMWEQFIRRWWRQPLPLLSLPRAVGTDTEGTATTRTCYNRAMAGILPVVDITVLVLLIPVMQLVLVQECVWEHHKSPSTESSSLSSSSFHDLVDELGNKCSYTLDLDFASARTLR
jgi:hypothetical protein